MPDPVPSRPAEREQLAHALDPEAFDARSFGPAVTYRQEQARKGADRALAWMDREGYAKPSLLPDRGPFPDASYEIPLELRLEAATHEYSHPRLGIQSTDKHTTPLTTAEARYLLTLLRAALAGAPGGPKAERR